MGLTEYASVPSGQLSYGRKRALEIATTLALDPEMMLLDEPTAGMTHEDVDRIVALVKRVAVGRTVLLVEHNLNFVALDDESSGTSPVIFDYTSLDTAA